MVKWPLGIGIYKLTAVWNSTPIIGHAALPGVVGHSLAFWVGGHVGSSREPHQEGGKEQGELVHSLTVLYFLAPLT